MAIRGETTAPSVPDDQLPYFNAFQQMLSNSSGSSQQETSFPGRVYLGQEPSRGIQHPTDAERRAFAPGQSRTQDRIVTGEEAVYEFNNWNAKRRADFIAQAKIAGLIPAEGGEIEAGRLWRTLVEEASYYNPLGSSRVQRITPWDILSTYVRQSGTSASGWRRDPSNPDFEVNALTGERRYTGPRFRTQTETAVNLTDPATAAAIATSMFQQLMGRDPGAGELDGFAQALRTAEQANPVVRSTTTEHDPVTGEIIGSDTMTEGGIDAAGREHLARQRVTGTQEYADVQAATTYSDALENLVWGAPSLGDA